MDHLRRFNSKALSDVILHVRTTVVASENTCPNRSRSEEISNARSFYLHKAILFQMPYFERLCGWNAARASNLAQASLSPAVQSEEPAAALNPEPPRLGFSWLSHLVLRLLWPRQPRPPSGHAAAPSGHAASSARTELVERMEDCELEAFELLLICLYKEELPEEARVNFGLMLQVYRLADKYGVPAPCLRLILSAVTAFEARDVDLPLMCAAYSLPAGLLDVPPLHNIIAACKRRLAEWFSDVPSAITDLGLQRRFCALPYAAVRAWLQSGDLKEHSESCIFLLISAWVNSKEHPACNSYQLKQLAHGVRVDKLNEEHLHLFSPAFKWFMELFSNVPSVITDLEQRRQFCALPYATVLAWLRSDDLEVHSESCVLLLLSAWVNSKEHPACSPAELKQLAHSVRVAHLSEVYLHCVLPDLKWFMHSCDSNHSRLLRIIQLRKNGPDAAYGDWTGPPAWISEKRKGTALPDSTAIIWELDRLSVTGLDAIAVDTSRRYLFSPDSAYLNGIFYRVIVERQTSQCCCNKCSKAAVTLGLYVHPYVQAMQAALGFWDCGRHPCFYSGELSASTVMQTLDPVVSGSSACVPWGIHDILGRSSATIAEVVAPFLVDGRLSLKAVIKGGTVMSTKSRGLSSEKLDSECPSPPSTKSKEL